MSVAVVGAGITGLAAAHALRRQGADVVLLESERRPGGVIVTECPAPGWLIEGGPDSFLPDDGGMLQLAAELGVAGRVVTQQTRGSAVWTGSELAAVSAGDAAALLGIQARPEELSAAHASFIGGMAELVDALAAAVGPALRRGAGVSGIAPVDRAGGQFRLSVTGGPSVTADAVIVTVPAWHAAHLLRGLAPHAAEILAAIRYAPSTTVNLAYRAAQVGARLEGSGFVVGRGVTLPLRACTYVSEKFPGRAPSDHALLRAFVWTDADPAGAAHAALARILDLRGEPLWNRVHHWSRGIPPYGAAQPARIAQARAELGRWGALLLAGAGYDGPGVGRCVASGREAARAALSH